MSGRENEIGRFERGMAHFNAGEFFQAHEVWEELWLRAPEEEKAFLQGLIQIAAAFHHFQRGNLSGARSLLAAGLEKTGRYPGNHNGIALKQLRDQAHAWLQALEKETDPVSAKLPRIRREAIGTANES